MQEEMKRGYFDDFKDLKETQGRMFAPSEALSPASTCPQLPTIAVRLRPSPDYLSASLHISSCTLSSCQSSHV